MKDLAQVEMVADPPGKFAHLGGKLSVVIDMTAPAGSRVLSLQHDCVEVKASDTLQLATNSFIAAGGDGYMIFESLTRVLSFGPSLADALADYLDYNTPAGGVVRINISPSPTALSLDACPRDAWPK